VERGYAPRALEEVELDGALTCLADIDKYAERIMPYDEQFTAWQDVDLELRRLGSPMRLFWGPYRDKAEERCLTGCIMGLKMFLGAYEKYAGRAVFATARPVVFIVGRGGQSIDARGAEVFLLGSCARAEIHNAKKIIHLDKCFTTASDMTFAIGHRLGMPAPLLNPGLTLPLAKNLAVAFANRWVKGRYPQDVGHFIKHQLVRRI